MKDIVLIVRVKALPVSFANKMAEKYVRDAVRGWQGSYTPDDSRVETFDWDTATVKLRGRTKKHREATKKLIQHNKDNPSGLKWNP